MPTAIEVNWRRGTEGKKDDQSRFDGYGLPANRPRTLAVQQNN
jgi:hypothetical protein